MDRIVTYEQPLNERLRTFLRIEQLMDNFEHSLARDTAWDTQSALMLLLEILNLGARVDLKSELMMELKRQIANMERLEQAPMVDSSRLQGIVARHKQLIAKLHAQSGQPGAALKSNEFLNSIRQRTIIPGGTCNFDLPAFHYWLSEPVAARHGLLRTWIAPFKDIHAAIVDILGLVRESATPQRTRAAAGFYQQNLDVHQPYQLIRILLGEKSGYYPEVSAGKHRFTVRFLRQPSPDTRGVPVDKDLEFALACCAL